MLITPELLEDMSRSNRPDVEIDSAGVPEATDLSTAYRGLFYRPVKESISIRLDADVVAWFRAQGSPNQRMMNAVLRHHMESQMRKRHRS